jgi:hypothetical protein
MLNTNLLIFLNFLLFFQIYFSLRTNGAVLGNRYTIGRNGSLRVLSQRLCGSPDRLAAIQTRTFDQERIIVLPTDCVSFIADNLTERTALTPRSTVIEFDDQPETVDLQDRRVVIKTPKLESEEVDEELAFLESQIRNILRDFGDIDPTSERAIAVAAVF